MREEHVFVLVRVKVEELGKNQEGYRMMCS